MTAKSSRRVVIINNIKSDKIEQAIFILRGEKNQKPNSVVLQEAQEIIDNYIRKIKGGENGNISGSFSKNKNRNRAGFIGAILALGA
ncbi:MAG: hypothetical protein IKC07_04855, partial [Clostridia bacterium]|nr:hypothetical protein [Clostridia bacterium]